jgi:hypothetical protein
MLLEPSAGPVVYSEALMIVRVLLAPLALLLGLMPRRLFVPREYELEDGERYVLEGTATISGE